MNYSQNHVNPVNNAHTKGIERPWIEGSAGYKRSSGNRKLLQGSFHEVSWRLLRSKGNGQGTLFSSFLRIETFPFPLFRLLRLSKWYFQAGILHY